MIRILLDQCIPHSTVGLLRETGWDVIHTADVGMSRTSDDKIIEYAREQERICVTQDADFHALLAVNNADGPTVIRIRRDSLTASDIAQLLRAIWPMIEEQAQSGSMITITDKDVRVRRLPLIRDAEDE